MLTKKKKSPEKTAAIMNSRGIRIFEAVVVQCAKSGSVYSIEQLTDGEDAHAEVDGNGEIVFVTHAEPEQRPTLH